MRCVQNTTHLPSENARTVMKYRYRSAPLVPKGNFIEFNFIVVFCPGTCQGIVCQKPGIVHHTHFNNKALDRHLHFHHGRLVVGHHYCTLLIPIRLPDSQGYYAKLSGFFCFGIATCCWSSSSHGKHAKETDW